MDNAPVSKIRTFRLWTYDVWGNAEDGFLVNDRYSHGYVKIQCNRQTSNAGTSHQGHTYHPTDRQLSRAAGFYGVTWDGQDGRYTADRTDNSCPVGELCEEE